MRDNSLSRWKRRLVKAFVAMMVILSVAVMPNSVVKAASAPSLSKTSRNILVGKTYNLNVNSKVKGSKYVWTTSNKKVATVDRMGIVTGKSKGSVVITCTVTTKNNTYTLTCDVTIIKPALAFKILNKASSMNVGQTFKFRTILAPYTCNDIATWTSSDKSIATVDSEGTVTALKEGSVTIAGKTLSGKKDSVTITVKSTYVTSQDELNAMLKFGVALITIKTDKEINLTIPTGDYSKTRLVVDAPKADITNNGVFASIEIRQIKSSTWVENAVGNLLKIAAKDSRVVIGPNGNAKIEVTAEGAKLIIENNGKLEEIVISKKDAELTVSGESDQEIPLVIDVPGIKITSSVPMNILCEEKITLVLKEGAEKTKIQAVSEAVIPEIQGNVTIEVKVGTGTDTTTKTIVGTPIVDDTTPSGNNPGGDNNPPTTTITFDTAIGNITALSLKSASNKTINIDSLLLTFVKGLMTNPTAAATWATITDDQYTVGSQTINIHGTNGNYSKTISISGGQFNGKTYTVTVSTTGYSVTITSASNTSVTFTKSADDKSFSITTSISIQSAENTQTLADICDVLETITVTYSGKTYTIDVPEVITIKNYINNSAVKAIAWAGITDDTRVYDSQTLHITGTLGSSTKTVTFANGQFAGEVYTVTVTAASTTIKNASGVTATITQGSASIVITLS